MSYLSHARPVNIPAPPGGRTRSPPSPARSPYVRSARDGGTPPSAWSQEWSDAPRPRSSASRYSSGSDLLFPMDSERGSGSSAGSSRHGSAEPPFMYSIPQSPSYTNGAVRYPTCSECGRPYYGPAPAPGSPSRGRSRRTDTALCPACHPTTWQPQQVQAVRRSSQRGFSPHTPYRSRMDSPPRSSGTYHQLRTPRTTEPPTPRGKLHPFPDSSVVQRLLTIPRSSVDSRHRSRLSFISARCAAVAERVCIHVLPHRALDRSRHTSALHSRRGRLPHAVAASPTD